jgi:hypothetical protein
VVNAAGSNTPSRAISTGPAIVAADFNRDGRSDLALAAESAVDVLLGRGNGTFVRPIVYRTPSEADSEFDALKVADFNGDGVPDLAKMSEDRISLLLNDGAGHFPRHADYTPSGSVSALGVADVNRDGLVDLLAANVDDPELSVFSGRGAGRLSAARAIRGPGAQDLAVGDLNGGDRFLAARTSADTRLGGVPARARRS